MVLGFPSGNDGKVPYVRLGPEAGCRIVEVWGEKWLFAGPKGAWGFARGQNSESWIDISVPLE